MKKLKGKIVNHNNSFIGEIIFDEKINNINKIKSNQYDNYIIPGFVDLHCHGGGGYDSMSGLDDIKKMSKYHLINGTTTLLPTTLTAPLSDTYKAVEGLNEYIKNNNKKTNIIGLHLEGPFINPNKLGAQPNHCISPSKDFINKIQKQAFIKVITIAPEITGMENFINFLIKQNIKVQFGHSLADYNCCLKIMKKNDIGFTHLYNAMSGYNHRDPGLVTVALTNAEFAEIICDLHHVNKENIYLAEKCIPKLYAISDSISATGKPDGYYKFSNLKITKKNGIALINSKTLAGSVINMHDSFKNLIKINFSLEKAVAMTSFNAANYISEKKIGKISKNYIANLVILDKKLNVKAVYLRGKLIS